MMSNQIEAIRILGIDPGTNFLGYSIIETCQHKTPNISLIGALNLAKLDIHQKLGKIHTSLQTIIQSEKPNCLAIESPFFGKNVQSMLKLGRVQGIAMGLAAANDMPIYEYAPRRIKQMVTGRGAANKEDVMQLLGTIFEFNQQAKAYIYDETDSLAVAYCHYLHLKNPLHQSIPLSTHKKKSSVKKTRAAWTTFVEQQSSLK